MLPTASFSNYQPRRTGAEHDPLFAVIAEELDAFLRDARERGRRLPSFVVEAFRGYLRCGRPEFGFTWLQCPGCGHDLLLAFSCKERGFCPSCGGRRMNQLAANLVDHVIPQVPVRQWVLSFPMRVRFLLARSPELRNEVLDLFLHEVTGWLREATGETDGNGGSVTVWQLAGSALNLNPHIHALVLDGVYVEGASGELVFRPARRPPRRVLQALVESVRARVERLLVQRGLAEDEPVDEEDGQLALQVASIERRAERAGGTPADDNPRDDPCAASSEWFDLHAGSAVSAHDRYRLERLVRYVARPPLSIKRMARREDGRIELGFHRPWSDGTTHVVFTPRVLLERLAAIVPHPRVHLVHYHGVLAPAATWRPRVVPTPVNDDGTVKTWKSAWIPWAELMQRVFGIDPMICGKCALRLDLRAVVKVWDTAKKILDGLRHVPRQLPLLPSAEAPRDGPAA